MATALDSMRTDPLYARGVKTSFEKYRALWMAVFARAVLDAAGKSTVKDAEDAEEWLTEWSPNPGGSAWCANMVLGTPFDDSGLFSVMKLVDKIRDEALAKRKPVKLDDKTAPARSVALMLAADGMLSAPDLAYQLGTLRQSAGDVIRRMRDAGLIVRDRYESRDGVHRVAYYKLRGKIDDLI